MTTSCTRIGNFAEKRADLAAYRNIKTSQMAALGETEAFTISDEEAQRIRAVIGQSGGEDPELLSLADVLGIAIANSRSYQDRKETLFIQALGLTEVQKEFNHDFSGNLSAETAYVGNPTNDTVETFGDTGLSGDLTIGVKRVLVTGASVSLDFSQSITKYFTSPDVGSENNSLTFNIVQPLLKGFGPLVSKERLRQAERDMIYAVRDFNRYQQDFLIQTAEQYYATLRNRDALRNARSNYESAISNREQTESYAKAGRIAEFQAAQARQSELNAADSWVRAQADYQQQLDSLRFSLGLPIDLNVVPDPDELTALENRGLVEVGITLDEALAAAFSNRLDLITQRERVQDRERKLVIQRREFLPNLDIGYTVKKELDGSDGTDVDEQVRLGLDLPFDWTERRNAYRRAQIDLQREIRDLEKAEDSIRLSVRDLWRKLDRLRTVYTNRLLSVELSARRVESTTLLLKQGKALTRDLLEAEDDLLSSRNQATVALVDYTITRLRFWDAIERFKIDPKGMWHEEADGHDEVPIEVP